MPASCLSVWAFQGTPGFSLKRVPLLLLLVSAPGGRARDFDAPHGPVGLPQDCTGPLEASTGWLGTLWSVPRPCYSDARMPFDMPVARGEVARGHEQVILDPTDGTHNSTGLAVYQELFRRAISYAEDIHGVHMATGDLGVWSVYPDDAASDDHYSHVRLYEYLWGTSSLCDLGTPIEGVWQSALGGPEGGQYRFTQAAYHTLNWFWGPDVEIVHAQLELYKRLSKFTVRRSPYAALYRYARRTIRAWLEGSDGDFYGGMSNSRVPRRPPADSWCAAVNRAARTILTGRILFWLLLFFFLRPTSAVTCRTCFDQCTGCPGDASCPFLTRTRENSLVLAGAATATATAVSMLHLLPLKFLRVLTRSVLDCLKTASLRPAAGTPVEIATMSSEQVARAVETGSVNVGDALREVVRRIATASTQIEISRLNALQGTLSSLERLGANIGSAGVAGDRGIMLGALTFAYAQAGRIVRFGADTTAIAGPAAVSAPADDDDVQTNLLRATISRPTDMAEFADILHCWQMILHATGLCNVLSAGAFVRDVVFDTIRVQKQPWQVAHELLLVYLEFLETSSDAALSIATVYAQGSQDTLMARAVVQAERHYGVKRDQRIFRPSGKLGDDDDDSSNKVVKWSGGFNTSGKCQACVVYNLGKTEHPARSLNSSGRCLFVHACDHWVSGKGKNGRCGLKHPRVKCDNPNRIDQASTD